MWHIFITYPLMASVFYVENNAKKDSSSLVTHVDPATNIQFSSELELVWNRFCTLLMQFASPLSMPRHAAFVQ